MTLASTFWDATTPARLRTKLYECETRMFLSTRHGRRKCAGPPDPHVPREHCVIMYYAYANDDMFGDGMMACWTDTDTGKRKPCNVAVYSVYLLYFMLRSICAHRVPSFFCLMFLYWRISAHLPRANIIEFTYLFVYYEHVLVMYPHATPVNYYQVQPT